MARNRRREAAGTNRGSLILVAGSLLILVGGFLMFLAGRENDANTRGASSPARKGTPAKPCPRRTVQLQGDSSGDFALAADPDRVLRPTTRRIAAAALTVAAAGAGAASPSQAGAAPARSADGFVNSIGVNVHLASSNTPYRRRDIVQKKLTRLGVRYVRDHLFPNRPDMYQAFKSLAKCGIKTNLIVGDPMRRWTIGTLDSQLDLIKKHDLGEVVESLEAPNEYDIQGDENWEPVLRDYQRRFYSRVKSDPDLRRYPVLGPSLVKWSSYGKLGDVSGSLDYGNIHPYPGGEQPEGRNSDLRLLLGWATNNSRSKPVQATETGYHNGVHSLSRHLPATERAAAIYMPRLFLEYYRQGVTRAYSYELIDERPDPDRVDSEANFGLLRNDYSEKPAYTAIRRTIDLLADPGPRFKTSALDYSVSGADVQQVLLQKRDGTFYLALWRDESVWNPGTRKSAHASSAAVRVSLGKSARRIAVYRPSERGRAVRAASNARSVSLKVSPSVTIVKIRTGAARKGAAAPYGPLRGKERRVARRLLRLSGARQARATDHKRRIRRLSRWLVKRSHTIRRQARRGGWAPKHRRVRYRAIRTVLRRA